MKDEENPRCKNTQRISIQRQRKPFQWP